MEWNEQYFEVRQVCPLCATAARAQGFVDKPMYSGQVNEFVAQYYRQRVPNTVLQGTSYTIMYCTECDFYWQRHILNQALMRQLYESWIDPAESLDKQKAKSLSLLLCAVHRVGSHLAALGKTQPWGTKALDFGGGWGGWCQAAKALGCEAYLLELSAARIALSQRRGVRCFSSLEEIGSLRFALINAQQVMEHVPDPVGLLRELVAKLEPGGGISIGVPNASRVRKRNHLVRKGPCQPLEHINAFTPKSLARLVQTVGLRTAKCPDVATVLSSRQVARSWAENLTLRIFGPRSSTSVFAVLPR